MISKEEKMLAKVDLLNKAIENFEENFRQQMKLVVDEVSDMERIKSRLAKTSGPGSVRHISELIYCLDSIHEKLTGTKKVYDEKILQLQESINTLRQEYILLSQSFVLRRK